MHWQTRNLRVGPKPDQDAAVIEAAELLRAGELVAFPTETVYGLGGDAFSSSAIEKIFAAKDRPSDNPLIVHIAELAQLERFSTQRSELLNELAAAFWPGPLTLVVRARAKAKATVTRGMNTIALRVPNHPVALALLRRCDLGIAAPSANRSGRPSPTQASHVYDDLNGRIPLILDGGPCPVGIESTVLDLSGKRPVILRPGTLSAADLAVVLGYQPETFHGKAAQKRSPGTRYRHYSPNVPVYLIHESVDDQSLYQVLEQLATKETIAYLGARPVPPNIQARHADAASFASQLYSSMRHWEQAGMSLIVLDIPNDLGQGVLDRVSKAATTSFTNPSQLRSLVNSQK